jgi:hypothetical protein
MSPRTSTDESSSFQQTTSRNNHGASAVATIWLVFYGLAVGAAITWFFAFDAINIAAR